MSLESHESGRLNLAYESWGSGDHLLICLHGYGKDRSDFRFLAESLSDSYTSLLIDLPFHGDSKMDRWTGHEPVSEEEWNEWLKSLIISQAKEYHSILGFSMGGRLALSYCQLPYTGFQGVILLATDGILMNPWNRLFTHTSMGRKIFGHYMRPSSRPESLAMTFERWKLISNKRRKLIIDNVTGAEAKQKLLDTWLVLRGLWPDLRKVEEHLEKKAFIRVYLGRHDKVIRPRSIRVQLERKGLTWPIIELNCGHDMMNKAVFTVIKEELLSLTGIE